MPNEPASQPNDPPVTWTDVTRFIRQLSHDLRNHLNAAELQAVFLNELATDAELKDEVKRLRAMLAESGSALQKLSAAIAQPRLTRIPYRASDLITDMRQKFENDYPDRKAKVDWQIPETEATLDIDPQLVQAALFELLENAFRNKDATVPLRISGEAIDDRFAITLREAKLELKSSPDAWGREPLKHTGQGRYGLGLNRVRMIAEAHGGEYRVVLDPPGAELISRILLPVTTAGN